MPVVKCTMCGTIATVGEIRAGAAVNCPKCNELLPTGALPELVENRPILMSKKTISDVECPVCKSDNWQRVDLAYRLGTSQHSGAAVFAGSAGGLGIGVLSGTQQTRFAQSIRPPVKRSVAAWPLLGTIGALLVVFALYRLVFEDLFQSVWNRHSYSFGDYLIWGTALLAGMISLFVTVMVVARVINFNKNEFPRLSEKWLLSHVCLKCGHVWLPQQLRPDPGEP